MKKIFRNTIAVLSLVTVCSVSFAGTYRTNSSYHSYGYEKSVEVLYPTVSENNYRTLIQVNSKDLGSPAYLFLRTQRDMKIMKNYLIQVRDKYMEWSQIAKANGIKTFRKPFDISSPNFEVYWNDGRWYSSHRQIINFHFFVNPEGQCLAAVGGTVNDWKDSTKSKEWSLVLSNEEEFTELINSLCMSYEEIHKVESKRVNNLFK